MKRTVVYLVVLCWLLGGLAAPAALAVQDVPEITDFVVRNASRHHEDRVRMSWRVNFTDTALREGLIGINVMRQTTDSEWETAAELAGRARDHLDLIRKLVSEEEEDAAADEALVEADETVPQVRYRLDLVMADGRIVEGPTSGYIDFTPGALLSFQRVTSPFFAWSRAWFLLITLVLCISVVLFIAVARKGIDLKVRTIAGLEAVDEAVGRATEMGRSVLFVPGIQDMNDIQTVAGLTVLSHVAKTAAEYDAKVEVPTTRSLVMTTARETVQAAYLQAGRPDAYNQDLIYYVTDEQFGYVAYLSGMMVREKPAACFYMGSFFAESLILAETGNGIGAIQIAGTAQPAQLPFFVAACDYTLIGEEFFAASAYLSGEPDQLGSLKGQDVGKLIVGAFVIAGCLLATMASIGDHYNLPGSSLFQNLVVYLEESVLS